MQPKPLDLDKLKTEAMELSRTCDKKGRHNHRIHRSGGHRRILKSKSTRRRPVTQGVRPLRASPIHTQQDDTKMKTTIAALLLVTLFRLSLHAQEQAPADSAKSREGVWKPVTAEKAGVKMPPVALAFITLTLTGDKYEVAVKGEPESDKGTSTIDTSVTPHRMTIKSTSGPNKGQTFLAIWEMTPDGGMRVCYDLSGTAFPADFTTRKGTQLYFVEYARPKAKADADFPKDGTWKPRGAMMAGERLTGDALKAITLTMSGANYEVSVTGEAEPDKGTFALDDSVRPRRMTLKSVSGPNKGKTFLAIYEMSDENTLRVCYDLSGTEFPKQFSAPKGTQRYLVGYRRQADSVPAAPKNQ